MEFTYPEMTVTVSNPFLQIWKGGIRPLYDTRNDLDIFAGVAAKIGGHDRRQARARTTSSSSTPNRVDVYLQRLLDASRDLLRLPARTSC